MSLALQTSKLELQQPSRKWLVGPAQDIIFNFAALWLIPLTFILNANYPAHIYSFYIIISTPLISAHGNAPFFLLMLSPQVRRTVAEQRPRYLGEALVIFLIPLLLGITSAILLQKNPGSKAFYLPITAMCLVYHLWNQYHYSMQNFGIMKIYRRMLGLQSAESDKFDLYLTLGLTFFVQMLVWSLSNIRIDFYTFFFRPPTPPPMIRESCLAIATICFLTCVVRAYLRRELSLPIILGYLNVCGLTIVICYAPLVFTLLANGAVHWLQAIFLTAYQLHEDKAGPVHRLRGFTLGGYVAAIMLMGSLADSFTPRHSRRCPKLQSLEPYSITDLQIRRFYRTLSFTSVSQWVWRSTISILSDLFRETTHS